MSSRWSGKNALVTGASSGIGAELARALCRAGLRVIGTARRRDRLDALAAELTGAPGQLFPATVDLRDEAAILAMFAELRATHGGVDVLVNAGGLGLQAPLLTGDTAAWREMLEVNVLATCVCTREAIADMRRRGDRGHVINIASTSAHTVVLGAGVYAGSKFAVRAISEGLRLELRAQNLPIRVTEISPGVVQTEFAARFSGDPEAAKTRYANHPLQPADIAAAVLYALEQPDHVEVNEVIVRPVTQAW